MTAPSPRVTQRPLSAAAGDDTPAPGVIGIGLAAVLTFALAQGSWQWFATFIGVTLLAVMSAFQRRAQWAPSLRSPYMRGLIAYSLVVGLCVAIALAPLLQRHAWLFPRPQTRTDCRLLGRYQALEAQSALGDLARQDDAALAFAQRDRSREAVADCLASTTTLWLPIYGTGVAVFVGTAAWFRDRARSRDRTGPVG
ncbi:hypothetical protein ABZZ79_08100 [Streptomyces sp. NPDC006458]|uniref:hypothetical protein n=1 Tax=Streptomyces sp. NPDC006458 TaxID=3154302 RepID=UPI0033B4A8E6